MNFKIIPQYVFGSLSPSLKRHLKATVERTYLLANHVIIDDKKRCIVVKIIPYV